jgi:5-methylcytosine-specific restriction endonuclease McrA
MSEHISVALIKLVRQRADQVCEYCLLPQTSQEAVFHVDHIRPRAAKGLTCAENLALACVTCSLKKAARTRGRDPISKELVPLFHPRQDRWSDHFRWSRGCRLIGRTATGRATILALA